MASTYMHGSLSNGLTSKPIKRMAAFSTPFCAVRTQRNHLTLMDKTNGIHSTNGLKKVGFSGGETMSSSQAQLFSLRITPSRKTGFLVVRNQVSDSDLGNVEEKFRVQEESGDVPKSFKQGTEKLAENLISSSSNLSVTQELVGLSLPAFGGQAIDPLAQLMETAYIGSFGPLELASAGISVSIFNVISKLFNIPLLGIATSFVAEDISKAAAKESASALVADGAFQKESNNGRPLEVPEKKQSASVSTALLLAVGLGVFEAISLYIGSGFFLNLMGVSPASSMRIPAERFLKLRAIGAPAVVLSLALQGIFRGVGNLVAVFLFPLLMYTFGLGVIGSAIATVSSQYITTILLIWILSKKVILLPPKMENLQFGGYVKSGGFLMGRTLAVLGSVTLGTSMAARQGPLQMAAHQICFQVWLAVSLLADALASSAQAMIASSYSEGDYSRVKEITILVLKTGLFSGLALTIILGASFGKIATLFTSDAEVLAIARSGILFVCASQPLNALAFVCDGLHYGVSDFKYAAQSMMLVGVVTSAFLLYAPPIYGLPGVWMGLSLFMGLRMVAGLMRFMSKSGPWWFLHKDFQNSQVSMY
ncbi:hypothetical protein C5167_038661 [Papaver somniferum]|uniref:Protein DETOXIFICATION n=1 Tax=Papaver somniferum TaxID=3469 RepID=A0A4Y7ID54_PAPSO|nr:hypothetical protein C5167_038661 [Papaver somniferum]